MASNITVHSLLVSALNRLLRYRAVIGIVRVLASSDLKFERFTQRWNASLLLDTFLTYARITLLNVARSLPELLLRPSAVLTSSDTDFIADGVRLRVFV